jgi:hypothetical protein
MAINQKKYDFTRKNSISLQNTVNKHLKQTTNEKYLRWTPCLESRG